MALMQEKMKSDRLFTMVRGSEAAKAGAVRAAHRTRAAGAV